jgi:hypothetical protein
LAFGIDLTHGLDRRFGMQPKITMSQVSHPPRGRVEVQVDVRVSFQSRQHALRNPPPGSERTKCGACFRGIQC